MNNIYFIAAPPRSGTSFIAGLLNKHGVWTGNTIPADKNNKMGCYENIKIVNIVKNILKKNGEKARTDSNPLVNDFYNNNLDYKPDIKEKIKNIVPDNKDWLFKGAKILLIYPFFTKSFPNAIWILPKRNRRKILGSLLRCKTWQRRLAVPGYSSVKLAKMIDRLSVLQEEISQKQKHIWVDTNEIINNEDKAKQFVDKCGLEFNSELYKEFKRPEIWHG